MTRTTSRPDIRLALGTFARRVRAHLFLAQGLARLARRRLDGRVRAQPAVIVLSMGAKGSSATVAAAAQARGHRVVVFCPETPFVEARFMDGWRRIDCTRDFDRALAEARAIDPVAVLVEGKNRLLPMQQHLAAALGLRGVGAAAVRSSNSKIDLRESLDRAGLPNLPWEIAETPETPETSGARDTRGTGDGAAPPRLSIGFPVVSKPDMGTSSMGVQYLEDLTTFRADTAYWDKVAADSDVDGRMMFEAYVDGRQFDVEGVARDGTFHPICIVEEYYLAKPPFFPPSWYLFNPPITAEQRKRLLARVEAALTALGVRDGGWHCESRFADPSYGDGTAPDARRPGVTGGEVYVLDYANRMGYNQMVSTSAGTDFAGAYVETMLPGPFAPPRTAPRAVLQIMLQDAPTAARARALRAARPDVVQRAAFVPYEFSAHRYWGHIVIACDTFEALRAVLAEHGLEPPVWETFYPRDRRDDGAPDGPDTPDAPGTTSQAAQAAE
ncbi:MAG: ATP-grasp domain-containing protein [Shimia sp.]